MSMNEFELDPITKKQVMGLVADNFEGVLEELLEDNGEEILQSMEWYEIAELFYTNGYVNGIIDATKSEELRETVSLMNDEIEYQQRE